jgi:hypothetical protein
MSSTVVPLGHQPVATQDLRESVAAANRVRRSIVFGLAALQGDDLYGLHNNRFLAGAEYVARANLQDAQDFRLCSSALTASDIATLAV